MQNNYPTFDKYRKQQLPSENAGPQEQPQSEEEMAYWAAMKEERDRVMGRRPEANPWAQLDKPDIFQDVSARIRDVMPY